MHCTRLPVNMPLSDDLLGEVEQKFERSLEGPCFVTCMCLSMHIGL